MKSSAFVALLLLQATAGLPSDRQNLGYYSFGFDNPGKCAAILSGSLSESPGSWVPVQMLRWKRPDADGDVLIAAGFRRRTLRSPQANFSYAFARSFDAGVSWECFEGQGFSAVPLGPMPLDPVAGGESLTPSQMIAYQAVRPRGATFSLMQGSCSLACVAGGSPPLTFGFSQNGVVCTKGNMQTFFLAAPLPTVSLNLPGTFAVVYKGQVLVFVTTEVDTQVFKAVVDADFCTISGWVPYTAMGTWPLGVRAGASALSVYDRSSESETVYLAGGYLVSQAGPLRVWDLWSWREATTGGNNTRNSFTLVLHTLPLPVDPPLTDTLDPGELGDAFSLLPVLNGAADRRDGQSGNGLVWQVGQDMWMVSNLTGPAAVSRARMRWWKRPMPGGGYANSSELRTAAPGVLLMATTVFNPSDYVPYYVFTELPLPLDRTWLGPDISSPFLPQPAYSRATNVACSNKCKMAAEYASKAAVRSTGCAQGPTDAVCTACTSCKLGERALSACGDGDSESGGQDPTCAPVDFLLQIMPKPTEASAAPTLAVAAGCLGAVFALILVVGKSRGSAPSSSLYLWCTVTVLMACCYAAAWACQAAISLALLHSTVDAEVVSTAFVTVPTGKDGAPFRDMVGSAARLPAACAAILIISLSLDVAVGTARAVKFFVDSQGAPVLRSSQDGGSSTSTLVEQGLQLIELASPLASAILKNGLGGRERHVGKESEGTAAGPGPLIVFFVVTDTVRFVVLSLVYLTAPLTSAGFRMLSTGLALTGCSLLLSAIILMVLTVRVHRVPCVRPSDVPPSGDTSPTGGVPTVGHTGASRPGAGRHEQAAIELSKPKAAIAGPSTGYGVGVVVLNPLSMAAKQNTSGQPLHLHTVDARAAASLPNDRASRVQHVFALGSATTGQLEGRAPVLYASAPSPSSYHYERVGPPVFQQPNHLSPSPALHERSAAAQGRQQASDREELREDGRPVSNSWEMVRAIARPEGGGASAATCAPEPGEGTRQREDSGSAQVVMVAGPVVGAQGNSDEDSFGIGSFMGT